MYLGYNAQKALEEERVRELLADQPTAAETPNRLTHLRVFLSECLARLKRPEAVPHVSSSWIG